MYEERRTTVDLDDTKGYIVGGSSHVGLTYDEQRDFHCPLGHNTPEREPAHKYFVKRGVDRDQTGYLSATPKMHNAAELTECSSTSGAQKRGASQGHRVFHRVSDMAGSFLAGEERRSSGMDFDLDQEITDGQPMSCKYDQWSSDERGEVLSKGLDCRGYCEQPGQPVFQRHTLARDYNCNKDEDKTRGVDGRYLRETTDRSNAANEQPPVESREYKTVSGELRSGLKAAMPTSTTAVASSVVEWPETFEDLCDLFRERRRGRHGMSDDLVSSTTLDCVSDMINARLREIDESLDKMRSNVSSTSSEQEITDLVMGRNRNSEDEVDICETMEDDVLYSSQLCKHNPGYQASSSIDSGESEADGNSDTSQCSLLQSPHGRYRVTHGLEKNSGYGQYCLNISPAEEGSRNASLSQQPPLDVAFNESKQNRYSSQEGEEDNAKLSRQSLSLQTRMVRIGGRGSVGMERQSTEEPDVDCRLPLSTIESFGVHSDGSLVNARRNDVSANRQSLSDSGAGQVVGDVQFKVSRQRGSQDQIGNTGVRTHVLADSANDRVSENFSSARQRQISDHGYTDVESVHSAGRYDELMRKGQVEDELALPYDLAGQPGISYERFREGIAVRDDKQRPLSSPQQPNSRSTIDSDIRIRRDTVKVIPPRVPERQLRSKDSISVLKTVGDHVVMEGLRSQRTDGGCLLGQLRGSSPIGVTKKTTVRTTTDDIGRKKAHDYLTTTMMPADYHLLEPTPERPTNLVEEIRSEFNRRDDLERHLRAPQFRELRVHDSAGTVGRRSDWIEERVHPRYEDIRSEFQPRMVEQDYSEIPVRSSVTRMDSIGTVNAKDKHCLTQEDQQNKEAQERGLLWRYVMEKELGKYRRERQDKRRCCEDTDETDHELSDAENLQYARVENVRAGVRHRARETEGASCAMRGNTQSEDCKDKRRCSPERETSQHKKTTKRYSRYENRGVSTNRRNVCGRKKGSSSSSPDSRSRKQNNKRMSGIQADKQQQKVGAKPKKGDKLNATETRGKKSHLGTLRDGGGNPSSDGSDSDEDNSSEQASDYDSGDDKKKKPSKRYDDDDDPSSDDELTKTKQRKSYTRPYHWMKPDKFDGKSSWETYLYHFENCAHFNRWNAKEKVAHLRWAVTGMAAQLLWGTEKFSYKQLITKLGDRFGGRGVEEKFQNELRCRRRSKNEPLRELAQDVQRLMTLAYPGEKSSLSEHIARDAFLTALDDPELELKIREREPADLEMAVKLAQRFEVFKMTVDSSAHSRNKMNRSVMDNSELENRIQNVERRLEEAKLKEQSRQDGSNRSGEGNLASNRRSKNNRAVNSGEQGWKGDAAKKIEELQAIQTATANQAQRLTMENENLCKELDRLRHLEQVRAAPAWNNSANVQQSQNPTPTGARQKNSHLCYNCHSPGHFARNCPEPKKSYQPQGVNESGSTVSGVNGDQPTALHVGVITRRNSRNGGYPTYLRATIGTRECDCLLDTGSEATLLPAEVVNPSDIKGTSHNLKAANGTSIPLLGEVTMPMRIGSFETTITGLVSEHIAEVMLGIDWLTANNVTWEFRRSRINVDGKYYQLDARRRDGHWCRRVTLQENVTIPARSEVDLPTKVICRPWKEVATDCQWGTEPTTVVAGVHVSRTLVPTDRLCDIPIRVVNVTKETIQLTAGLKVAELHPLTVVEPLLEESDGETTRNICMTRETTNEDRLIPEFIEKLMEKVHPSVPETTTAALRQILTKYEDVFSKSEIDLGATTLVKHRIDTGGAPPFRQPLRRFPPAHVEAISEHIDNMLGQGVIEPACSPYASNIVLVKKRDNSYHCCVDYRQLNSSTRKDAYPLPRIDACLDAMATAKWFSTFDLRSSYHQVQVEPEDRDKTAFICPRGMYRFKMMPFGLCNAGATFQRLMDIVMTGLNLNVCLAYLDEIICYSATLDEHLERLTTILQRLRTSGLKLKPEKCALFQKSVSFLGHLISEEGIGTDPQKTQAVWDWPTPTCIKEVRSFVGLASYYRRFVKDFAKIAAPLHSLVKKNQQFQWSQEAQESFNVLKQAMTSTPILAMPTDNDEFTLDTDASDYAIGAVLSQRQDGVERVIAYASRSLDRRERNYCVTRKELLAVVYFLRYFKQYLLGRQFKVRTDHAALTWLRRTPDPIGQQARWLELMEEYNFTVEHRPGVRHGNADAMSRRPCPKKDCACKEEYVRAFGGPADHSQSALCELQNFMIQLSNADDRLLRYSDEETSDLSEGVTACETNLPGENTSNKARMKARSSRMNSANRRTELDTRPEDSDTSRDTLATGVLNEIHVTDDAGQSSHTNLPWSWDDLKNAQRDDEDIGCIIRFMERSPERPPWDDVALTSADTKTLWNVWPRLSIRNGLLKRRFEEVDGKSERWQVIVPTIFRLDLLKIAHGGMTGGHLGRRKTAAAVQSRAYWPTWSSDLDNFLRSCEPCARYHRGSVRHQTHMQISLVGEPWERVSVDITGPHPRSSNSHQYILTLVDHFSKWAEAIPLTNHTAPTVARALMTHVFSKFGAPRQLLTDRGPEFESELFAQLMKLMEIDKLRTTPYKPSTNGVVERFHRTLNSMLGKVVNENQRDWHERLPFVLAAYRASPHASTGYSPNRLFLGRELCMPLDLIMGVEEERSYVGKTNDEFVRDLENKAKESYEFARRHLRVAAERRKKAYDIRVKEANFKVGDWVWYWYPRRYTKKSPKWQRFYVGPFLIVRFIAPVNYVLQRSARSKPFVVHADKIKRCYGDTAVSWLTPPNITEESSTSRVPEENSDETTTKISKRQKRLKTQQQDKGNPTTTGEENVEQDSPNRQKRLKRQPARLADFVVRV